MGRELVLIGAGHAHLTALVNLPRYIGLGGHATVINPGAYQYYSGMGPGMLSGMYPPQEVRFNVKQMTESGGGRFIDDHVTAIDPVERSLTLCSGEKISYDVASFNIGSVIDTGPLDDSYENVVKAKPVENLFHARCALIHKLEQAPVRLAVIGGGAAGVELAGNAWKIGQDLNKDIDIHLISNRTLLPGFPGGVRKRALKRLHKNGIRVSENLPVKGNTGDRFLLEDGSELPFDMALIATGTRPPDLFKNSAVLTGDDGGLLVNKYLQSIRYPELFGGGDCIDFQPEPLRRIGVYAVRQNPVLLKNLEAALLGEPLTPFVIRSKYMLILNMGDGTGIFNRRFITFSGKQALKLKHYIDKKFMDLYQVSGETSEQVNCPNEAMVKISDD